MIGIAKPQAGIAVTPMTLNRHRPQDLIWQAPLVPAAILFSAGIVLDRVFSIPLPLSLAVACALLFAFTALFLSPLKPVAPILLGAALIPAGAGYHQWYRESIA